MLEKSCAKPVPYSMLYTQFVHTPRRAQKSRPGEAATEPVNTDVSGIGVTGFDAEQGQLVAANFEVLV